MVSKAIPGHVGSNSGESHAAGGVGVYFLAMTGRHPEIGFGGLGEPD